MKSGMLKYEYFIWEWSILLTSICREVVTLTNLGGHRPALEVSLVDIRFELHDKDLLKYDLLIYELFNIYALLTSFIGVYTYS